MADVNQDPTRVMLNAFQAFVRHAAEAHNRQNHAARDIWLNAANHLISTNDTSVGMLIQDLALNGQFADAETIARAFACLEPHSAFAHFNVGFVMQMSKRHADAIAPYRAALAINPEMPSLRNNLASALLQADPASDEACKLLEEGVEENPHDTNCWINLATLRVARFELDKALKAGERALKVAPDNHLALNNHALHLREAQRWDDAERCARAALAPDNASYRVNLGMLLLMRGDFEGGCRPLR